jgi:mono/diheme cytochrome c family protein
MIIPLAFAIVVLLATWGIALAGGWAVVTLDHLPSQLVVNQPITIGFNVRGHGQTPLSGLKPTIAATRVGSEDTVTATAHGEGATGHYVATLTFPAVGNWEWYIDAYASRQPMPPLTVAASRPESSTALGDPRPVTATATWPQELLVGSAFVGSIAVLVLLLIWRRRQLRWWVAPLAIGIVLGAVSMAVVNQFARPAMSASSDKVDSGDMVRQGHDLFLAKGCIVCHQNARVQFSQEEFFQVGVGPNLTNRKLTSEFLHIWLKDPSKVRPGTLMPTLGLSDQEIDALATFLTAEDGKGESQ